MKSNLKITLELPSSIYYADNYAAVRSILGNDVELVSLSPKPLILPDNQVLVDVEYIALDFNSFIIYKVLETKILNNMSSKVIVTKLYDPINKSEISELVLSLNGKVNPGDYISLHYMSNANYRNKTTLSISNSDSSEFSSGNDKNENIKKQTQIIKYYYTPVTKSSFLKSYCSVIDTSFLSYHGSTIQHTPLYNETIKEQIPNTSEIEKINEYLNSQNILLSSNNFSFSKNITNSFKIDEKNIKSINFKDFEAQLFKHLENNENSLENSKNKDKIYIINLDGCKYSDLFKLNGITGIILDLKCRTTINSFVFISDCINTITENIINNLITVLEYDTFNYKLINQKNN